LRKPRQNGMQPEPTILIRGGSFGCYVATGHLISVRKGTLRAVSSDLKSFQVHRTPRKILDDVSTIYTNATGHFAVAQTLTLAYASDGSYKPDSSLVIVDRQGSHDNCCQIVPFTRARRLRQTAGLPCVSRQPIMTFGSSIPTTPRRTGERGAQKSNQAKIGVPPPRVLDFVKALDKYWKI
jgi:hypothetical protein